MATESISVWAVIPASPERVYEAWLDSEGHAKMTGGPAKIDPRVGGEHSAWGGYISGETRELEPGRRIVQSWRSSDFPADADHSTLVITLEPEGDHTKVSIDHSDIPEGQGEGYRKGWHEHYFEPMAAFFGAPAKPAKKAAAKKKAAPKKAAAKKAAPRKAAKKGAAKKATAKKSARKAAPKKAAAKKGAAKKGAAKKGAAKKSARKAAPRKAAKKGAAKKGAKKSAKKKAAKKA
jgi:uncharacterized protein YndB with AHSA1/START domain